MDRHLRKIVDFSASLELSGCITTLRKALYPSKLVKTGILHSIIEGSETKKCTRLIKFLDLTQRIIEKDGVNLTKLKKNLFPIIFVL